MTLSICICSLDKRLPMLHILMRHLQKQIDRFPGQVEILVETDNGAMPTGTKRNILYNKAQGKYVCSVDDDDWPSDWYVEDILRAVESDPDAVGMTGTMSTDGKNHEGWSISCFHPYMVTKRMGRKYYLRYTNHLTPVRRSIAIQFPFPDKHIEEDYDFATAMHNANAIKTEALINRPMYEYRYISKK